MRCLLLFLLVLGAWWSDVGCVQETNLTFYSINPCSNESADSVSLLKSDIYAVQSDFTLCNISFEEAQSIGLRIISWTDGNMTSSESDLTEAPIVFVTRQTLKGTTGVLSWDVPFSPQGFTTYFNQVNRTMCPNNVTDLPEPYDSGENETRTLLYIDVFSSSFNPVQYNLKIEIVPHFIINLNEPVSTLVAAAAPQIYYFKFPNDDDVDAVTVDAYTESDICAFVSVQSNLCPVNDLLENVRSRGIFQSMSKSAFLTVKKNDMSGEDFVLVFISVNNSNCHGPDYSPSSKIQPPNSTEEVLFKQNITFVVKKQELTSKFIFAILFPFIIFVAYLVMVAIYLLFLPRLYFQIKFSRKDKFKDSTFRCEWPKWLSRKKQPMASSSSTPKYGTIPEKPAVRNSADEKVDCGEDGSSTTLTNTLDGDSVRSVINETNENKLLLPRMCKITYKKLYREYRVYGWNTVTVGIFYALPAFQLILSEQKNLNSSGDQDKCYYNFKCAHPLGVLTAFNNLWSNIGYILLGLLFIIITWNKKRKYLKHRRADKEYVDRHGIPLFFGVYYAMGNALILEGFMSAFYHICPTPSNFQFDTAFMFIIGGLLLVKIIQNRHPDINSDAFIAFFSFAVIIFFTLLGIYFDRTSPVPIRLVLFTIVIILVFLFFVSFYRFHQWSFSTEISKIKEFFAHFKTNISEIIKKYLCSCPKHKFRFFKLFIALIFNLGLALYAVIAYTGINIATAVLGLFIANLVLFLIFYVFQKFYFSETFTVLPLFLLLCMGVLWGASLYFFKGKNYIVTDWEKTPAESRARNHYCALFGFYDYHDIWHFLSANAMFLSFLFLLTLDDGIMETDRNDLHIF